MVHIKEFNELTNNELYQILRLRSAVFVVEQNCIYQDIDNNDQHAFHIFIQSSNHIIGYLRIIQLEKGTTPIIGRVVVSNQSRNNGHARNLMNESIHFIYQTLTESQIVLSAQQYLVHFYESLGFKTEGAGYLEDGIPHIQMIHVNKKD